MGHLSALRAALLAAAAAATACGDTAPAGDGTSGADAAARAMVDGGASPALEAGTRRADAQPDRDAASDAGGEAPAPGRQTYRIFGERFEQERDAEGAFTGHPGGEMQYWHSVQWCPGDPRYVYATTDVAGVWRSADGGRSWRACRGLGLHAVHGTSIAVDPIDPNLLLVIENARTNEDKKPYVGAYRSTDGGASWTRVIKVKFLGEVRSHNRAITWDPGDVDAKSARTWYLAFSDNVSSTTNPSASHGLWRSTDRGVTWTRLGGLPAGTFGNQIRTVLVNPANGRQLYVTSAQGFFLLTLSETRDSFSVSPLDGAHGLPAGGSWTTLEIDEKQPGDITVVRAGSGVFRTTGGVAGPWKLLYPWPAIYQHAVAPSARDHMTVFSSSGNTAAKQARWSDNALSGAPTFTTIKVTPRPGTGEGLDPKRTWIGLNGQNTVLYHPTDAQVVLANGSNSFLYRSIDGGRTYQPANDGFTGLGVAAKAQMWHPSDVKRWALPINDVGVWVTTDKGDGYRRRHPNPTGKQITTGLAICPHDPDVMLAAAGPKYAAQPLHRTADGGQTWTTVIAASDRHQAVSWSRTRAGVAYAGQRRSTDYGVSWTALALPKPSARVWAVAPSDGDVIAAVDNGSGGAQASLWVSRDGGASWSANLVGWSIRAQSNTPGCPVAFDPDDANVVWTRGPDGTPSKLDLTAGEHGAWTHHPAVWMALGAPQAHNGVKNIAIDPRHRDIIYAQFSRVGTPFMVRSTDGGASWHDITYDLPLSDPKGITVNPFTGDLLVTGQQGSRVLPPPYPQSSPSTLWDDRASYGGNTWMGPATP